MPLYDYRCLECEHTFESFRKMDSRKDPESEACPNCTVVGKVVQSLSTPLFCDPVRLGKVKTDSGFQEVLQKIHSRTAGSRLNEFSNITKV